MGILQSREWTQEPSGPVIVISAHQSDAVEEVTMSQVSAVEGVRTE